MHAVMLMNGPVRLAGEEHACKCICMLAMVLNAAFMPTQ